MRWPFDPVSLLRGVSTGTMFVFGLALAGVHGIHLLSQDEALLMTLAGTITPLVLAIGLSIVAIHLHRCGLTDESVAVVVAWTGIGAAAIVVISVFFLYQQSGGAPVDTVLYAVASSATGGAFVGSIAGRYDARNREKAELIETLQEATADLTAAMTPEEVCRRAADIAHHVLGIPLAGVWLYDETENALEPAAVTTVDDDFETLPTFRPGESLSWNAFASDELIVYDNVRAVDGVYNPETGIRSEIIVPLGEYGVMNFGSSSRGEFDDLDVTVSRLLGTAVTAVLRRADREAELRRQRRELERQNERLEEFTSVVSHDLRNPLNVALGRLEFARDTVGAADGDLATVANALDRMEILINDLLDLAKQGTTVGETSPVSVEAVARNAWKSVVTGTAQLNADADAVVDADERRLQQLFENLFANSMEHGTGRSGRRRGVGDEPGSQAAGDERETAAGEPPVTVSVGGLDGGGFYVADDGPGVPEGEREAVFEVGYTTRDDGTGFGLTTVRRIAEAHGWSVQVVESELGGARFEIRPADEECDDLVPLIEPRS